jgi:transposase
MNKPTLEKVAWIGLDAHAHFCVLGWLDDEGERKQHWRFPTTEAQVVRHLQAIPAKTKHLALEECGLGRWLAQVAQPQVPDVIVSDPRHNQHISRHHHKCDEEDAFRLAQLHRLGALKKVWQPTDSNRAVFKCAGQAYLDAVERQTALKLQLKAHYRQWGVIPTGTAVYSRKYRGRWLGEVRELGVRLQLQLLYQMLDEAVDVERQARRLMIKLGKGFPEIERLETTPGVGKIGAHLFVAYVQEPSRFPSMQTLFRYCRLGIRDRSSDGKPLGYQQLDRQGHGVLKAISYRAWLQAVKRRRGPVYEFYQQSLLRTGHEVHARLNTQRKILLTLWVLWKKGKEFDGAEFLGTAPQLTTKVTCH